MTTIQLVAVGAMDRLTHKIHIAARIRECKVDPETGQIDSADANPCTVVGENYYIHAEHNAEHNSWYIVAGQFLKSEKRASKHMMNILQRLPMTHDVCGDILCGFLGWKTLGISLPRVFQKMYHVDPTHERMTVNDGFFSSSLLPPPKPKLLHETPQLCYILCSWTHFLDGFIRRQDVTPELRITLEVSDRTITQVTGTWLLTRPETDYIPLPFTVTSPGIMRMQVYCSEAVPLYYVETNEPRFSGQRHTRWITQVVFFAGLVYPGTSITINPKHLVFRVMLVLCYRGRPVRRRRNARFKHPITKLSVALYNTTDIESDGDFFEHVMPGMFNGVKNTDYVVYQVIYHPPPRHYGHPEDMFPEQHYSTVNASRIPDEVFLLRVTWDETVVKDNFVEPEKVSLEVYVENFNLGVYTAGCFNLYHWN